MNQFQRIIGVTYHRYNYFNVGVDASFHLGEHGEHLTINLFNGQVVKTFINRNINNNGSVRFYGGNLWHQFILDNYNMNEIITFQVNNPNTITIMQNAQ